MYESSLAIPTFQICAKRFFTMCVFPRATRCGSATLVTPTLCPKRKRLKSCVALQEWSSSDPKGSVQAIERRAAVECACKIAKDASVAPATRANAYILPAVTKQVAKDIDCYGVAGVPTPIGHQRSCAATIGVATGAGRAIGIDAPCEVTLPNVDIGIIAAGGTAVERVKLIVSGVACKIYLRIDNWHTCAVIGTCPELTGRRCRFPQCPTRRSIGANRRGKPRCRL